MDAGSYEPSTLVITTSLVTGITAFLLGLYSGRGYIISPELKAERRSFHGDPVESDESDVDEVDAGVLDHAPNWSNTLEADARQGLRERKSNNKSKSSGGSSIKKNDAGGSGGPVNYDTNEECKLMLVVRTDLGMTKGKIAAQCSHATLACYDTISRQPSDSPQGKCLSRWRRHGQAKVAVQVKSQAELESLMVRARDLGLVAEVIQDAGRTQIDPGSLTVLGVGPAPKSAVDLVTGGLKLL